MRRCPSPSFCMHDVAVAHKRQQQRNSPEHDDVGDDAVVISNEILIYSWRPIPAWWWPSLATLADDATLFAAGSDEDFACAATSIASIYIQPQVCIYGWRFMLMFNPPPSSFSKTSNNRRDVMTPSNPIHHESADDILPVFLRQHTHRGMPKKIKNILRGGKNSISANSRHTHRYVYKKKRSVILSLLWFFL